MAMPKIQPKTRDFLRSYECHGLLFNGGSGDQVIAECPFCYREGCVYLKRSNCMWDCKVCHPEGGNLTTFLRELYEHLEKFEYDYSELASERGLLDPETCKRWGVVQSLTGRWLVPGYNDEGKLVQL